MQKHRWKIAREPDIYLKVLRAKEHLNLSTISKTISYIIRDWYDKTMGL
jgi:hypothetical protein